MSRTFNEEQRELRRTVRAFLEAVSPETEVRRLMESERGYDPAVWRRMAELGLQGTAIPERYGGSGAGWIELAIVFEEMGRTLLCAPYFSTVALAATALLLSSDEAMKSKWLPRIASGETIATVAYAEEGDRSDADGAFTQASPERSGWRLDGRKMFVLDGHTADLILVVARAPEGLSLFAVDADGAGLERKPLRTLDGTRKQARLDFAGTRASRVGREGQGADVLGQTLDLAVVALAAEQLGGAERLLETSVGYAKVREQFGRPIGSFQAVQHKCVDMLLEVESARAAACFAARLAADPSHAARDVARAASAAKTVCSEAFSYTAAESIQVHGGIGFTWEHPGHLYFRRAKSSELLFETPDHHRERLVSLMELDWP